MGWTFRKRIKIAKGVSLNLSKSGIGASVGGKGLSVSTGKRGTYVNTSIPGTGLSNRSKIGGSRGRKKESAGFGSFVIGLIFFVIVAYWLFS